MQYNYSKMLIILTSALGFLVVINLPWFNFEVKLDDEKIEQLLDEALEDEYDEF